MIGFISGRDSRSGGFGGWVLHSTGPERYLLNSVADLGDVHRTTEMTSLIKEWLPTVGNSAKPPSSISASDQMF